MKNDVKTIKADPRALLPNPWNSNRMSPENEAKLDKSIARLGMFKPVVVRETKNGLEILGGQHRAESAARLNLAEIPVINLGAISDEKAKEISIIDNGRYGSDDTLQLAKVIGELGDMSELATFMPFSDTEIDSIFSSINIDLDDLDLPEDNVPMPELPKEKKVQTHQILRFKIPSEDAMSIAALIESAKASQNLKSGDSLQDAGDALVYLLKEMVKK